jgi:hypothetical protein
MNAAGSASKPSVPASGENGGSMPTVTHASVETISGHRASAVGEYGWAAAHA